MTVIDFEEYKKAQAEKESRRKMRELIDQLDEVSDYVYENYDSTRQTGYENFKKLLKRLDEKYDKED